MILPDQSWSADDILAHLRSIGVAENLTGMARFGINTATALGIGNSELRPLARKVRKNHERALLLWK
ncbi:DNA alkylation repair protein, partial [Mesorhizobium sp. M2C.T.Ca.TU.009.01.2.1]